MKKKINWWVIIAVLVIGVPVGYVGMGMAKKLFDKWSGQETEPEIEGTNYYLTVRDSSFVLDSKNGIATFEIDSNTDWVLSPENDEGWLRIEPSKGNGQTVITLTAEDNSGDERRTEIKVSWKDEDGIDHVETLSVKQDGNQEQPIQQPIEESTELQNKVEEPLPHAPYLNITPQKVSFKSTGGNSAITLKSNADWEIAVTSSDDWLSVNPKNGRGNKKIAMKAASNGSIDERSATLKISWKDNKGATQSSVVTVFQAGTTPPPPQRLYLTVTPTTVSFAANGGETPITLKSNSDWNISLSGGDGWLTVANNKGSGSKTIKIKAAKNEESNNRIAKLTITWPDGQGSMQSSTVNISQAKTVPKAISKAEVETIIKGGKVDERIPDNCTIVNNGSNTTYGKFRSDLVNGKFSSVTVLTYNTDKNSGNAVKVNVKTTIAPPPVPISVTKEEAQAIVASGQKSSKVPDDCTIIVNGSSTDYQAFRQGVNYKAYTNVKVKSVEYDTHGKATSITVSASVRSAE